MFAALVLLAGLISYLSLGAQSSATLASHDTAHLKFTASVSPRVVVPGEPFTLAIDVAPRTRMHVYAPGSAYRPIRIAVEPQASLTIKDTTYPKAAPYYFKPLNETVDVYDSPFRLTVEMMVTAKDRVPASMTLKAALEYQACDDRVCYLPESIPLEWTMRVQRAR